MSGRGRARGGGGGRGQIPARGGAAGAGRGRGGDGAVGGRGRGGGLGEASGYSAPPPSVQFPAARGGGAGGGRGRSGGRGETSGYSAPPPAVQFPPLATSDVGPSVASLSGDVEQKLTVRPSPAAPLMPAPPPVVVEKPQEVPVEAQRQPPASSKAIRFPPRPGIGAFGRKCVVRANHFLVEVADRDLHHYDVSITPEVIAKKVCRDIISQLVHVYGQTHLNKLLLAYDGRKSVYTAGPLPFQSKDFAIKLTDKDGSSRRERDFKVSIKLAAKVDLHHLRQFLQNRQADAPQETIQALDVVLRGSPSDKYVIVGRSFFSPSLGKTSELGEGLCCWKGFYQSLRPTQMGLSLNIDMSARAFYEPIYVHQYIQKYLNLRDLNRNLTEQDRSKVKRVLKGVKVETSYQGQGRIRRYKISSISNQPIGQIMFSNNETGTVMSVAQYFLDKYGYAIKFPMLPAIQAGSDSKPVSIPMEVCKIVDGQRYLRKLNENQVASMLKATCQRPFEREKSISEMAKRNNYNVDDLVKQFGIVVRPELATIEARVLPPPRLMYHQTGKESLVDPRVGQWNMINKKMLDGGKVNYWTCISFSRMRPEDFCYALIDMCCSKGMSFSENPLVPIRSAHSGQIEKSLYDLHRECAESLRRNGQSDQSLQMLIIILPDFKGTYGTIKRICETELGIVSQCCDPKKASRISPQYLENVALKINVKVGGRNNVLEQVFLKRMPFLTDLPTIIFGADVTHPQPGEDSSPSIAAVVASMDWPYVTKYKGLVSAQTHREEIIQDLYKIKEDPQRGPVHSGMIKELLVSFYKSTGQKPKRIIFYRDGVSEGQFSHVLLYEMDAIRKACASLEAGYLPPVTFVVVQKRHHTRLFPANHQDRNLTDKSGNILPGTVVDTKICHPNEFDFYLCSHAGIQGTSRPTHYHVLFDENRFTADHLQILTNSLCYTYARCTRSVSIVPPAYYAHLAAFRARYYIEGETSESGSTSASGGAKAMRERSAAVNPLPEIKANVKEVMFYC